MKYHLNQHAPYKHRRMKFATLVVLFMCVASHVTCGKSRKMKYTCQNSYSDDVMCDVWSRNRKCDTNFMAKNCEKSCGLCKEAPLWNDLKVTWSRQETDPGAFDSMPRTLTEATTQGFTRIPGEDGCDSQAKWRGHRYMKGDDYSVILLFDKRGYIAGIQTSFLDNQLNGYPSKAQRPPFIQDGNRVTITAYFVRPKFICRRGRNTKKFSRQGTGSNLYIQTSEVPEDSMRIPRNEKKLTSEWIEGQCFPLKMGKHYWYKISRDMSCDDLFPVFLLFSKGRVTGFGWSMGADLASPRYEHPPPTIQFLSKFIKAPPSCLEKHGVITTMHIFLTRDMAALRC